MNTQVRFTNTKTKSGRSLTTTRTHLFDMVSLNIRLALVDFMPLHREAQGPGPDTFQDRLPKYAF